MKNIYEVVFKLIIILILLYFMIYFESSALTNKIFGIFVIIFSLILLYKTKRNLFAFIIAFFILYSNYSIVVGEYLVGGDLGIPLYRLKTEYYYGTAIRVLLFFISIVALFLKSRVVEKINFSLTPKDNIILFYALYLVLVLIWIFGIDRSANFNTYKIVITPIYEYATIIFLFAIYSSGFRRFRIISLMFLLLFFVLQDFYYGGRITSLQLILVFLITVFLKKLNANKIIIGGTIGILINSIIGTYRKEYSLDSMEVFDIVKGVFNNYFVFDTPVYAYYATVTHLAATELIEWQIRIKSFFAFIFSIFTGSNELSNVTSFVANKYYFNYGGGLIPTHFYYWLGWFGIILIASLLIIILNRIGSAKKDIWKMVSISVVMTVPRWYLYTPLSLFRQIFLIVILYCAFIIAHNLLLNIGGEKRKSKKHIKSGIEMGNIQGKRFILIVTKLLWF